MVGARNILFAAILVLAVAGIFNYGNLTGFVVEDGVVDDPFESVALHWNHMPLTYDYDVECSEHFYGRYPEEIRGALDYITEKTNGSVSFVKGEGDVDIFYDCDLSNAKAIGYGDLTAEAHYSYDGDVITGASVDVYATRLCLGKGRPITLIHETLHVFGLEHSDDIRDIMYDKEISCLAEMSQEDVNYLLGIYG